jgi:cytochrome c oxidase subunit 2
MNELVRELLGLPPQASTIAEEVDWLHYSVIGITMMGAFAIAAAVFYLAVRYRAGRTVWHPGDPVPRVVTPFWLELGCVGTLVLLFFGWWLVGVRQYGRMQTPPDDALPMWVVGKQWMWTFTDAHGHESQERLVVPVGRPVRLVMTSRDVIHSFFVPAFRIKHDVVPGRFTSVWFEAIEPGVFPILCAEYCGTEHSLMRGEVVVLSSIEYAQWLEAEATIGAPSEIATLGERVAAERGCLRCHTTDGSPHVGPSFAGLFDARVSLQDGTVVIADEEYLTRSMMDPAEQVHAGFAPVMPSYRGALDPGEAAALVELVRALADRPRWDEPALAPRPLPLDRVPDPAAFGRPRYPAPAEPPR